MKSIKNPKNLLMVIVLIVISISCKKSSDDEKSFEKSLLIGTWKQTAGTDFVACSTGDNRKIIISDTQIKDYAAGEDGCITSMNITYDYTYASNKMSAGGGAMTLKVDDVNATTLKLTVSYLLLSGSKTETYTKQ